jgi:hypothetical protein
MATSQDCKRIPVLCGSLIFQTTAGSTNFVKNSKIKEIRNKEPTGSGYFKPLRRPISFNERISSSFPVL